VGEGPYPGTCRWGPKEPGRPVSWRVRFDDAASQEKASGEKALGDFVVRRSDGLFSYQLAVVVDDAAQGITHVVRGADLLESTPWQNRLQMLLGYPIPQYRHIPIVTNEAGEKLSKQTGAEPIDLRRAAELVREALRFLGQPESSGESAGESSGSTPREILHSAALAWR
jgi:glutamyl-Q tRNA(Asp) synthetase